MTPAKKEFEETSESGYASFYSSEFLQEINNGIFQCEQSKM